VRSGGRPIAAGLLLLVTLLALGLPSGGGGGDASVLSTAPEGRRALYLLAEALAYAPRLRTGRAGFEAEPGDLLWLADPPRVPDELRALAAKAGRELGGGATAGGYRSFVEAGGTLVAVLDEREDHALLDHGLGLGGATSEASAKDAGDRLDRSEPRPLDGTARVRFADSDEELELRGAHAWDGLAWLGPDAEALVVAPDGAAVVGRLPLGAGELWVLAADAFLANDAVDGGDHALLAVRLFERGARTGTVWFDESSAAGLAPRGPLAIAFGPALGAFSVHVLAWIALLVWTLARPRAFPRDPGAPATLAPASRAAARARLYLRAGRPDALARSLCAGWADAYARRAGLTAARGGAGGRSDRFEAALAHACRAAGLDPEAWGARPDAGRVEALEELVRLEEALDALDAQVRVDADARVRVDDRDPAETVP